MRILLATRSPGKQAEFRKLLVHDPNEFVFPDEIGIGEMSDEQNIEIGNTFSANARLKAEYFVRRSGLPTVAEDSGLEVFALGGRPGVRSKRFALPSDNQDDANNQELLRQLSGAPPERRGARYRCVMVFIAGRAGIPRVFDGMCRGRILESPRGTGGFGYDPLFFSEELDKTFAEASPEEKNSVSHRARAVKAMRKWLSTQDIAATGL